MPSKIYKSRLGKDKLILYLPMNVISKLGLKDGDLIDFVPYDDRSFLFMNEKDVSERLKGDVPARAATPATAPMPQQRVAVTPVPAVQLAANANMTDLSNEDIALLKKLNTVKYQDRTKDKIAKILDDAENQLLQKLIRRKVVSLYKKPSETEFKYGISPSAYTLLMAKRAAPQQGQQKPSALKQTSREMSPQPQKWEKTLEQGNANVHALESQGFVVLTNEADAANVSAAVEESIRRGLVVGTRAFNKKYYIALKSYVLKNSGRVLPVISSRSLSVAEISKATSIEEDGIRAILYILAETGEVSETRRDYFKAVQ